MVFRGLCVYSCCRIVLDDSKDLYCSNPVDFVFCGIGTFCGFFILFSYLENSLTYVPARGMTNKIFMWTRRSNSFNPRSRKGNDSDHICDMHINSVSIHVPARGTTSSVVNVSTFLPVSIHVPARGTTEQKNKEASVGCVSIHVPTRGTTAGGSSQKTRKLVSIHVPTRGTTYINQKNCI